MTSPWVWRFMAEKCRRVYVFGYLTFYFVPMLVYINDCTYKHFGVQIYCPWQFFFFWVWTSVALTSRPSAFLCRISLQLLAVTYPFYIYLNINQIDALNFCNEFISCLYMFRAHVLIVRRSKFYYTASGIITPIGGRPVHRSVNLCTGRPPTECEDTRCCIIQFWPPDDEHLCSKHVEAWNKLIIKLFSASSSLILR